MSLFAFLTFVLCLLQACTGAVLPQLPPLPPFMTLEEHFVTAEIVPQDTSQPPWLIQKLEDLDTLRLDEMDKGHITKQ